MTFNSGSMAGCGGTAWVSAGGEPEPVRIDDADVRADEHERVQVQLDETVGFAPVPHGLHQPPTEAVEADRELFTKVAEVCPGIVRTLSVLIGELADADLEPLLLRQLGDRVCRVGESLILRADRLVIDPISGE